ncbi:hypothetical protein E1B28_011856 [Marasmius oreades]|uniref:Uncharacterized protein n=1 Tax=Marasmius oreades TaxID=181124 RepID=A0A9P7USK0_9AGAR|nr:uncharacterized protein E1B28_011856 [Marasmius oreades]KAG7090259.1 hypothetical protein E1B28_011856 [Marasmius oreades]
MPPDRIHFVRPCIHSISHIPSETTHLGPFIIFSQWVIECTIGNLGEEVKNHSSPYANLEQRGIHRCQVNALKALIPDLETPENTLPRGAMDIGDGFILLRARDCTAWVLTEKVHGAWKEFWSRQDGVLQTDLTSQCKVVWWAKLRLPNGQTARSCWKEEKKQLNHIQTSQYVKFQLNNMTRIGEVHFYFADHIAGQTRHLAIVSLFGLPHSSLLTASKQTYITMENFRDIDVHVIEAKSIHSVVIMASGPCYKRTYQDGTETNHWFMSIKPGLKIVALQGYNEVENEVLEQEEVG